MTKRISPQCLQTRNSIITVKRYIVVLILLLLIIPVLYLIPCNTSKVKIRYLPTLTVDDFDVWSYSNGNPHNLTIQSNGSETEYPYWRVKQVNLILSSYISTLNTTEMLQSVIYGKTYSTNYRVNTLTVETFNPDVNYQLGITPYYYSMNNRLNYYECPVDYILSYLQIVIESTNQTENFEVSFYHFFQNDLYTEIKLGLINEISISSLVFENSSYNAWINWVTKVDPTIPSEYPYQIELEVRRYNLLTEQMEIYSI